MAIPMLALLWSTSAAVCDTYRISSDASELVVRTDRAGFLSMVGHRHRIEVTEFEGSVQFDPADPTTAALELRIDASSLLVADADLDDDSAAKVQREMEERVLEIATYPTILFRSTAVKPKRATPPWELEVTGLLTLHGTSRVIAFPVVVQLDGSRLEGTGSARIKQTDFGISPVSAGLGAVKVKDEVEVLVDIVALPASTPTAASPAPDADATPEASSERDH